MKVLQANELNNGRRSHNIRHTTEVKRVREFPVDLLVIEKSITAILMNCDNQTIIAKVNNSKDNTKSSRHVKGRLKYIRKFKNSGVIALNYIPTAKNLASPFTKGLSRNVIDNVSKEMDLRPTTVSEGETQPM